MAFTNRERNFRNLPDIQKELWLENERLPKGHPGVSTGGRFEIHGSLNVEVFKKAVANTLKHDEALSATFTRKKNRDQLPQECTDFPIVVINQYPDPDFEFIDISHFRNPRKEASIQERLFINRPFHPIEGQLCRFRLLKLDDSHYHFLSYYFHVIIDGINALGHFNRISQSYDSLINNNENLQLNLTSWSSLEESEANYKQSKRYQRDRDYWKAKLNNTNLEFTFPVRPGFSDSKLEVDRFELDIPREISDMLSLFSETDGIRSAPVLLALEYLTLAKTYDLNTVTIYVPVRFISSREANHAIGYTVNVIPLSLTIDQHGSFRELIRLISTELLQIIRHDRCSWQSVVRDSNIDLHSDPRGITTWNQLILPTFAPTGTTIEQIIPLTSEHEQLAFGVYIVQNTDDENYHISVNYSKCHFTASRVKLHFDRYFYLLEQCLHSPDKPLYMLDYLLEEEKKQLQHCEMGLKKIYDITTVCELIEKRAEVYLDNIAVIDSSEEITYRELIRRVHCLASFLISQGIQPGDSVAVVTHRHPRLAETILGIMKSGAVYVPITTDMPEERVLRILDEASARYVIIMKKGDETLYSDILPWVNLADIGTPEITNYPEITPEDTAYIIFTSGSTGRPKGVRVPHKAIINTIHSQSEFLEITPQDRILQFASPSFDASLSEIFMALFKCASLFHATRELIDEPWQLRQEMENHKISVVTFPPSYLRLFDHADFKGLRVLLTAGEAPILEDVQYYSKHLKYVNAYGPTEAAICAAMKQIAPEDNSNVITLGRPTDNTRIMILDSNLKQLPPGIPGEICLSGSGLAKGYLDNSQTEKSFVNSHVETGLRIYRTGDIGLWTDEGELFFIGRKDSQVKIHGHRVELHEIEFQLLKLDAIHQAVVLYSKDENNIENLIAFYVPAKSEDTIDPNLLRDHLRQTLPVYMIPSKYVKLDTIHTTVSGKIDSKLLLQSAHAVRGEDKDDIPNSPLKENFRAILSNVFGESCREISFSSDLYMLGTDSIKLMRLGHQISEKFNVDFPFREIMKANTIKYLFELVVKKINDQPGKETASIGFQPIDETLALTESQRQLWTLYQMDNNPVQYTMPLVLRIETTGTKLDAFLESLTTAINSQPVFHLGFYEENDHQYAKFHENTGFIVEKIDYSNENESEIYANRKIREIINRRFDLEKPPLIRCSAIKTAMNLYSLVISIHHIAGDGQSLFGLLDTAFAALEGKVIPHIPLSILASAGREEIEYLNSRDAENDLTYFKALFTPEPVRLSIFQSKQRLNRRKGNGDHVYRILDKEIYSRFSQLASQVGTTPLVVWISLVQSFLSWKTGSQDISVAVPVSTRNRTEYQSCAGYFVNTTVIRTSMDSSVDFFSRCSKTGDTFRQVLQHSQYPFLRLVSALEFKRDVSRSALVDIMVTWSDEPPDNFIRAGLSVTAQRLQLESSKFDAVFLLRHPENHPVEIVLEYDTDLAEKSEAETLINELMVYIKSVMLEQNTAQFSEATHSGHIPDDEEDKFGNNSSKVLCANHEIALRNAWASILGSSEINQDSNFFFEGGDSIKAIRIVSKLRSMGFSLTPAALFEIPRFGDMVKYLERDLATIDSNQPDGNKYQETKKLLNPVQRWLIKNHPDHWRDFFMSAILEIPSGWKVDQLEQCLNQVVQRHPILGRSFINDDEIDDPGRQQPDLFWQVFNHDTSEELFELFESTAEKMTKWITPEEGKLFSCSLIKCDSQNYLMIIGHHLVLDAVSFEIIIEEIEDWFSDTHFQFKQDTEFDRWAEELSIYPLSEFAEIERQYWKKLSSEKIISNPEFIHKGNSKSGKRQTIATSIDITYNFNPLGLNSNHRYGLLPIILSSFSSSLSKFIENGNILIQLEGHGRSIESTGSSAGDAVGWFTAPYPFLLPVRESSKQNVRNIETALSEVPNGGSTFGSLYPLGRNELNLNPKIAFNFIHAFKESTHDNSITLIDPYSLSENWINLMVPTDFGSDQPLEALVTHDNHSIHLSLTFNSDQVDDGFAQSLLNHWKNQLLTILAENEDVYQHEVQSGHDIESISRQIGIEPEAIESIYPLTSTQEGMFFQSRLEGEKSTSYTEQIQFRIAEKLDTNLLEKAWNDVLARHEGLRARFVGMESGEVLQVILSHSFQPITIVDISNYSESDSEDEALKILEKWQHKTYDLTSDSLIHFLVISTRENETLIAWNCHHILIDGWCIGLLLEDLFNIYNQLKKGRNSAKEKTPGLAPYFQWLKEKKLDTSKIWWQNKIGSIKKSSPIVQHMVKEVSKTTPQYYEIQLQDNQTKKLVDRSREAGLSLPVIIQCAWAAVLGKLNNSTDVVFGLVTLGRPFEIHGLEKTVGNFIHTLPMRVQFAEDELFTDAAKRILDDTFAMQTHEALPLADIFNYNPIGTDLFDHILDFHPLATADVSGGQIPEIVEIKGFERIPYPFAVNIVSGNQLTLRFLYNSDLINRDYVEFIAEEFSKALIIAGKSDVVTMRELVSDDLNAKIRKSAYRPESTISTIPEVQSLVNAELVSEIINLFREVLKVEDIAPTDNFIELGGHSLTALRVLLKLEGCFGIKLELNDFFKSATAESVAQLVEYAISTNTVKNSSELLSDTQSDSNREEFQMSTSQERLWFLQMMAPDSGIYNIFYALRLTGDLYISALERAIEYLILRHSSLRIRVPENISQAENLKLRYASHQSRKLKIIDLSHDESPNHLTEDAINQSIRTPFKFGWDQDLFRIELYKLNANEHVLVLVLHHIIMDGWSAEILNTELGEAYTAFKDGKNPGLPEIQFSFNHFVTQQRLLLESEAGKEMRSRWISRFTPLPDQLELPVDFSRPKIRQNQGAVKIGIIEDGLREKIVEYAKSNSTTIFPVLLTAVKILLARLSSNEDIVTGIPVSGRSFANFENVVGCFINTVPLRNRIDQDITFNKLIHVISSTLIDAIQDQQYPFETLVDDLNLPRDPSRNPLFDILVSFQDSENWKPSFSELKGESFPVSPPYSKFDLSFYFFYDADKITIQIEYATDLFKHFTIETILGSFKTLLVKLLELPETPLKYIPILSENETNQVIDVFNRTEFIHPIENTLGKLLKDSFDKHCNNIALRSTYGSTTYPDLYEKSVRVAQTLITKGIKPGNPVFVCLNRSIDLMAAVIGVQLAGAVYVPVDSAIPSSRLKFMVDDLGKGIVLTENEYSAKFQDLPVEILATKDIFLETDVTSIETLTNASPDDLAYIIFTSGSTGLPKGVAIEHRSLLNRLYWMQRTFNLRKDDVLLLKTSISFDVSIWELFWWSISGASLALLPTNGEREPGIIVDEIERHKVTVMHFVPSMLRIFLEILEKTPSAIERIKSLRYVIVSGEELPLDLVSRFNELIFQTNGTELHNLYGPTETTIDVTHQPCSPLHGDIVPIGHPVDNTKIYILDDNMQPVPIGAKGEITVSGVQVARGYVNRDQLTTKKFVANPFGKSDRLYKTGDYGRWLEDGSIEYLGRIDNQVKIRGFRIELQDIEKALEILPGISRAFVKKEESDGLSRLDAFLFPEPGETLDADQIRSALTDSIPEYMIPNRFLLIEDIPYTSSGKVNRKQLRGEPLSKRAEVEKREYSPVEKKLLELWKRILPDADIGLHDTFFEAGGDSLRLIRLHEAIEKVWPGKFTLAELFSYTSIQDQAAIISKNVEDFPEKIIAKRENENSADEPIAIIGMAVRLADFDDLDSFWDDLLAGADRVREFPAQRKNDLESISNVLGYDTEEYDLRVAAYIDDVASFDHARFRLAPVDASMMDPEQRIFQETAVHALENAGYGGDALENASVGVFVGSSPTATFRDAVAVAFPDRLEQGFVLNVPSNIATRLSYLKNWNGPAGLVDTACSSALNAVHLAIRALHQGDCRVALVGGVKVMHLPVIRGEGFTIDSTSGRTHAFDVSADGTGSGEGAVAFLLKPLSEAMHDGDAIHALLLGSAVNQDGHSSGIAAPNPSAQAEVIKSALKKSKIKTSDLNFIEAHGTGTALGDPIEIQGITSALKRNKKNKLAIGSVKGNYGHLDAAAGALGLAKAVLCLKHGIFPKQPFYTSPNPRIDFDRAPVFVPTENINLVSKNSSLKAGVSSFGLSGVNAHIILESPPKIDILNEKNHSWFCIPFSASSDENLYKYITWMSEFFAGNKNISLQDTAFTLAQGRDHLACRAVICSNSIEGLNKQLLHLLVHWDEPDCKSIRKATVQLEKNPDIIYFSRFTSEEEAENAAEKYTAGYQPAWQIRTSIPQSRRCTFHLSHLKELVAGRYLNLH